MSIFSPRVEIIIQKKIGGNRDGLRLEIGNWDGPLFHFFAKNLKIRIER